MEIKFCPSCGNKVSVGARFCGKCGRSLANESKKIIQNMKRNLLLISKKFQKASMRRKKVLKKLRQELRKQQRIAKSLIKFNLLFTR